MRDTVVLKDLIWTHPVITLLAVRCVWKHAQSLILEKAYMIIPHLVLGTAYTIHDDNKRHLSWTYLSNASSQQADAKSGRQDTGHQELYFRGKDCCTKPQRGNFISQEAPRPETARGAVECRPPGSEKRDSNAASLPPRLPALRGSRKGDLGYTSLNWCLSGRSR